MTIHHECRYAVDPEEDCRGQTGEAGAADDDGRSRRKHNTPSLDCKVRCVE
jgi:hypothetical protein